MAVFVICRVGRSSMMQEILNKEFPDDHYQLADGQWLVATSGTARALSDRLEKASPNQNHGNAVIMRVASYWGPRAKRNVGVDVRQVAGDQCLLRAKRPLTNSQSHSGSARAHLPICLLRATGS